MQGQIRKVIRTLRPVMAACMVLVLLALALLSANAPLHRALIHHSANGGNGCVVCLFVHGQVALTDIKPVLEPAPPDLFVWLSALTTEAPWNVGLFLPPGRAPPLTSAVS
ncbi:MAG: hypothetical protein QHJ82_03445 [Verrucomicrobiota bacterium]|nr:hypothetical protein [Verrucomicrobiota bacterium]